MVFISRLKLRNFKSFKAADMQMPKTFICFAGPNGSGKSNLCDAIRFVMGETSLKSLRAKKVRDLIHSDSKSAEVTISFEADGDGKYDIKRAIREDGKIRYRLNGKRTTRSTILETVKRHNLDQSGRNTIAQGEVQRIIAMNGKERRLIVDSVAGIADFEEKKKEALGELGTVGERIKEASLVLGERRAFLDELKREKEVALRFIDSKKSLTNAKATLLRMEQRRLEKELSDVANVEQKIAFNRSTREQEMADIEASVREVDSKRAAVSNELQSKQNTGGLIRKVEELRASCATKKQLIEDRESLIARLNAERKDVGKEVGAEQQSIEALKKELEAMRSELRNAEGRLAALGGMAENEASAKLRKSLEQQDQEFSAVRERLAALAAEGDSRKELLEAKKVEEAAIQIQTDGEKTGTEREIEKLRSEARSMAEEIDRSFARTKEVNAKMVELDKEMLELKEKASIFRVRTSPQLANPALAFINDLKQKQQGIYGTVADLITFDPDCANAVEAAGGARLLYVVVDSVDTATGVIDKLRKAKAGRATFIPLDTVKTPPRAKAGKFTSVLDVVNAPQHIMRAAEYVFADTVLVDSVADAKKLGVGSGRMVTLEGEIFERSGIVSGGRTESGILSGNQLRKIEKELADVRTAKESMLQELYSIREQESGMRAEKSRLEIKIKTLEMENKFADEKRRAGEQLLERKAKLKEEIAALEASLRSRAADKEKLVAMAAEKESSIAALRSQLQAAEEGFRREYEEAGQRRADLTAEVSSLRATIEGKMKELELRKRDGFLKEERLKQLEKDGKVALQNITEVKRQLQNEQQELVKMEEKISATSKDIEKLFEGLKAYEQQYTELGKKLAEKRMDVEKLNKDANQLMVKKVTATTRLEDIKAEAANFQNAEFLELKKDELTRMIGEAERALAELGNVNMAAIDMYGKKKAEIDDAQQKIEKLESERQSIMAMISEIEEHKKTAFFETFQAVSDNFSRMFKYIQIGDGHLYLDKPATPFDSGLFIKLRRNNRDYALEALSGGEKTLVALMFIFALQFFKPAPFYILDEVDAALDKPNSRNLAELVAQMTKDSQFIVVSHNDIVMSSADSVIGVAKVGGISKLVGIKLKQVAAA